MRIAEDELAQAEAAATNCLPPAPTPPPSEPPPPSRAESISASVVFNFDRSDEKDIRPWSLIELEGLVARVKREGLAVHSVKLIGDADRLNGIGHVDYSNQLSEKRVPTISALLQRLGLPANLITMGFRGDHVLIQGCEGRFKDPTDLHGCLLPNRRVEVKRERVQLPMVPAR